ncbi:hypothetical protein NAP1_13753 [Erythrobacter sp. NAP1]|uniref:hypothetical protein n=1 Tax=Erythrobacter sp. NAP1 TaxID=237727 RepID=UPI00006878EF|nr:hypothetical protein [Erythrobacter sp. NAP1]EAQ28668.1 hypothetical protein NAP1_13753 [Erythrobacter sp. NAP1]
MTEQSKSLLWAAIIIAAALVCLGIDLNTGASFGVISGLSGAAWGSLSSDFSCGRSCVL